MSFCKRCGRRLIPPMGSPNAEILLVGDAPTGYDVKEGQLWTGPGGDILKIELANAGIHMKQVRITNMWLHPKKNDCYAHMEELLNEMNGKKFILLMGADPVKHFTNENVSDVSGLRVDTFDYAKDLLPAGPIVYAIYNPAMAMRDKMGEVRLGFEKFGRAVNEPTNI